MWSRWIEKKKGGGRKAPREKKEEWTKIQRSEKHLAPNTRHKTWKNPPCASAKS
jgi:hypothetical protein